MSDPTTGFFPGNMSALDGLSILSPVGSRVTEISYVSPPVGDYLGNFTSTDQMQISLSAGSRVVEVPYNSPAN